MCQKLQIFLKENKVNFLIKYDSVREDNKYTVMLFDTVKKERISGGDTNSVVDTERKIIKDTESNVDFNEINELFSKIKSSVKTNSDYVVMLSINYSDDYLDYTIYLDNSEQISHNKFRTYKEIKDFVRENYE
ncbi:hypothetical protein [Enterococcus termitis]|uniref:Uncharacterized protein n=1 Tax=Enterococcus termitis TaxID=332950 RepID=A0A1E5GJ93_9ENTE|nr:hypothetical protein [Enterococcus termitis]OEG12786.1 hypothetical protein BCR25_19440 [Enterococcus termitis]